MYTQKTHAITKYIGVELVCDESPGLFSHLISFCSVLLVIVTLPVSIYFTVKSQNHCHHASQILTILIMKEYERAVIFRLGRLLTGGARGPGVFFVIPCVDSYQKIDMRTKTYEIPPQEVTMDLMKSTSRKLFFRS